MSRFLSLLRKSIYGSSIVNRPARRQASPRFEALEPRWVPSTFTEIETNNTAATANFVTVTPGDRLDITGQISSAADLDYFRFTLAARSGVYFDIDSQETGLSATLNSILTLFATDGTTVLDSNNNGYDFDTGFPAPATASADSSLYRDLAAGTYFIRAADAGGATGSYLLRIEADTNYTSAVPALNSLPGASDTIFLDFNGHAATDAWGTYNVPGFDFNGNAAEFTPGEQRALTNIWRVVSEDYSPFNINVSTNYAGAFTDGTAFHVVYTGDDGSAIGAGGALGVSFLFSYATGGSSDQVNFVFHANFDQSFGGGSSGQIMATPIEQGNTTSHEVGHALGLRHFNSQAGGVAGNADIIANAIIATPDLGLDREIWAAGLADLDGINTVLQDDMAVISNVTNTFGYRPDDHGDTIATATVLTATGNTYSGSGIIARPNGVSADHDVFRFSASGATTIAVNVDDYLNDLDVQIRLLDSGGAPITTNDPAGSFDAAITQTLSLATYYVDVFSHGGNGEAGQYTFTISTTVVNNQPTANDQNLTTPEDTDLSGALSATDSDGPGPLTYRIVTNPTHGAIISFNVNTGAFVYRPDPNYFNTTTPDSFTFVANDGAQDGNTATIAITVAPVADRPSVTNTSTALNTQSTSGLIISLNPADTSVEVTHFKITGITGGILYQNNGSSPINDNQFITVAEGGAGLKFTPTTNSTTTGHFTVQASTSNLDAGLGVGTVTADIVIVYADLSIAKVDSPDPVVIGNTLTYTITVKNNGPSAAVGANIFDSFPVALIGASYVSSIQTGAVTGNTSASGNLNDSVNMSAGAIVKYTVTGVVAVSAANTTISNTATVSHAFDPNSANNAATATSAVKAPDLTLTKSNDTGGVTTLGLNWRWTARAANVGSAAATFANGQTILVDNLPTTDISYGAVTFSGQSGVAGTPFLSGSIVSGVLTVKASGGNVTLAALTGKFDVNFTATPSAAGMFDNPTGGIAKVDPNGNIVESNEGNNIGSNSVLVNPALVITTTSPLAAWTKNHPGYSQTIATTGGTGAKTFTKSAGTLPTGLTLNASTGKISGTPTVAGTFMFTIKATDTKGAFDTQDYTVVISPALSFSLSASIFFELNKSYTQVVTPQGGTGTLTLSYTVLETPPTGLSISPSSPTTGPLTISGTPTQNKRTVIQITVTDSVGATATLTLKLFPAGWTGPF